MKLLAPGKSITLKPTRPNLGVEVDYRARLDKMVCAMHKSVMYWLTATYRANPSLLAADASPAAELRKMLSKLGRRWIKAFEVGAKELADYFAEKSLGATDGQLKAILKKAGFSVPFTRTGAMREAFDAVVSENVALIKSIAVQHLHDVDVMVAQSVARGRDLATLTDQLGPLVDLNRIGMGRKPGESDKSLLARTRRRAALIARDQNNKATAVMDRARKQALGITQAKWMHSGGGKEPRPSHVTANGVLYDVAQGCLIDGEYIMPGELPNCRCVSQAVIPGWDDE